MRYSPQVESLRMQLTQQREEKLKVLTQLAHHQEELAYTVRYIMVALQSYVNFVALS